MDNKAYVDDTDLKKISVIENSQHPKLYCEEHDKKNDEISNEKKVSLELRQFWASLVGTLATFVGGLTLGYSAILLPQLETAESSIKVTETDSSWIASMAALTMAPGTILGIYWMERYGRKNCLLIQCVPLLIGWLFIIFANSVELLLIGRFLTGICIGISGPPSPIIIGETSLPKYRGMLLATISTSITVSILFVHVLGTFLTWRVTAIICAIFPVLQFIYTLAIPETPLWLMSQNRKKDAENSLIWLRGNGLEYIQEFEILKKKYENYEKLSIKTIWESLTHPKFYVPFSIIIFYFIVMQFSGVNVVTFYTVSIMNGIFNGSVNEYLSMFIVDITRVITSIAGLVLARKLKRRLLTLVSGVGTAVSIFAFSGFSYLIKENPDTMAEFSWISLVFLVLYIGFLHGGIYTVPWMLKGEYFTQETRGVGSGLCSMINTGSIFVVVKTSTDLFSLITIEGTFFFYGAVVLVGTIILYFWMIESKNKTLLEIEEEFRNKYVKI